MLNQVGIVVKHVLRVDGRWRLLQLMALQPLFRLHCMLEVVEEVGVVEWVGDGVGRLRVDGLERLLPR